MKTSRFRYSYRDTASKLHQKLGDTLRKKDGLFSGFKIYQEYPVNKINQSYHTGRHRFDWIILDLQLVIECHGEGHYVAINWGDMTDEEAEEKFMDGLYRDREKQAAALAAGFTYVVIPYWDYDRINQDYIWNLYQVNKNTTLLPKKAKKEPTDYEQDQKEKARLHRKEQYKRKKEWVKALNRNKE